FMFILPYNVHGRRICGAAPLVSRAMSGHVSRQDNCRPSRRERRMKARIRITLKNGVLDPQGKAIQNALAGLGYDGIAEVRQGKYIEVDLAAKDEASARAEVDRMCRELLANLVIEDYAFELTAN